MFLNFSNHPSAHWGKEQLAAAQQYGEVVDLAFPAVESEASTEQVHEQADGYVTKILQMKPDCVLCQGEFCLSYRVIDKLKEAGVKVVAACSNRETQEVTENGMTKRLSYFVFQQFREY